MKNSSSPAAEIVLPGVAVAREREAILRDSRHYRAADLTTLALRRKRVAFVIAELALLGRGHELQRDASRGCCRADKRGSTK